MLSEHAERCLPFTPEALFDLAADIEQYPRYLPGWHSAWIASREAGRLLAEQSVGFGPVRLQFRTTAILQRPLAIEVTSEDPQFKHFRLAWTFAADAARGCRVGLGVELEVRAALLQRAIESLAAGSANAVLEAFARRAQQVLARSSDQGVI